MPSVNFNTWRQRGKVQKHRVSQWHGQPGASRKKTRGEVAEDVRAHYMRAVDRARGPDAERAKRRALEEWIEARKGPLTGVELDLANPGYANSIRAQFNLDRDEDGGPWDQARLLADVEYRQYREAATLVANRVPKRQAFVWINQNYHDRDTRGKMNKAVAYFYKLWLERYNRHGVALFNRY